MDLKVTQENLSKALQNVARVASGRSTLPILSHVLLKTVNNRLSVSATNLDIGITQYVGSKINVDGSVAVPGRLTQDFVSNLPSGTNISLKQEDHKIHIDAELYKSTINGANTEEFPVMPTIKKGTKVSFPAKVFKAALQQVIFAASGDETRPVLTGVYIYGNESKLYIAATDSYRLAEKQIGEHKEKIELLIPANALQELQRIMNEADKTVDILFDEQQVLFTVGDIELIARLIDGKYPDYQKLIPAKFVVKALVDKQELLSISKISSLFSRENANSITLEVKESDQSLSVQSIASQVGENTSTTNGKVTGSGTITLNSRYLLDGIQAIEGSSVEVCFNGKLEPLVLRDPAHKDYVHLVMPLKS